jgi:hypothetical protein
MSCANENVRVNSDSFAVVHSVASKVVDFRSYARRRDFERRKRDRQLEAPPSRAAGIQVENAADRVDLRYVGMASTILNESNLFNRDRIERQLAHVERNEVRRAYNAAEWMADRRLMMQSWADYITDMALDGNNIVRLSRAS